MVRKLLGVVFGVLVTIGVLVPGIASAGFTGTGTVTATPEKNSTGDEVDIDVAGNCAEAAVSGSTLIVVVEGPDGGELDRRELASTSNTMFTFDDTDQPGVYTVTADCDVNEGASPDEASTSDGTATPSAVLFSYEADTFEVFEPEVSATRVFTNDPASPLVGVVAGQPTFTG